MLSLHRTASPTSPGSWLKLCPETQISNLDYVLRRRVKFCQRCVYEVLSTQIENAPAHYLSTPPGLVADSLHSIRQTHQF